MSKKFWVLCVTLIFVGAFALVGCGGDKKPETKPAGASLMKKTGSTLRQ